MEQCMRRTQEPGKSMSQGLSRACGKACEAAEERTVYSIVPPADSRSTGSPHSLPEQESGRRSGWHRIGWTRRNMKNSHNRSAPEATSGQLQGAARQASLHPKSGWKQRPLGIASLEDKIVQYALVKILNAVYETTLWGSHTGSDPGEASTMHWTHWPQGWYALT